MDINAALNVSADEVKELQARLRNTRWAEPWPISGWSAGTEAGELRRLAAYWADGFDWAAQQRQINALPWFEADMDGTPLRYLRFEAERPGALPLVLTNGWPSTALELVQLARQLARPTEYGGRAEESFTVVVPALPGFPLSPQRPTTKEQSHELWHRLMHGELGYRQYGAHGGDLGAGITSRLAEAHPEAVVGIHLLAVAGPIHLDPATLTLAEQEYLDAGQAWAGSEGAYEHQQRTRPLSLAPALSDSPVGLLAWILEKYRAWSDCGGVLSTRFSDDFLLTQASLYWFSNSISTSFRPYWEYAAGFTKKVQRVTVPTAVAVFPFDLSNPPRSWAARSYNVTRHTTMPRGGHFAPHEEPELLAADIRNFFATLR